MDRKYIIWLVLALVAAALVFGFFKVFAPSGEAGLFKQATSNLNLSLCNNIEDAEMNLDCVESFIQISNDKKDPSYCENDAWCISALALENENLTLCDLISDSDSWMDCAVGFIFKSKEYWNNLCLNKNFTEDEKYLEEKCILGEAIYANDEKICAKQRQEGDNAGCVALLAAKTKRFDLCNEIEYPFWKAVCFGMQSNDISGCNNLDTVNSLFCKVLITRDVSICRGTEEYTDCVLFVDGTDVVLHNGVFTRLK